jgi:hypothetical protein
MQDALEDRLRRLELEVAQTCLAEGERVVERQRELALRLEREAKESKSLLQESEQRLAMQIATRDRIDDEMQRAGAEAQPSISLPPFWIPRD